MTPTLILIILISGGLLALSISYYKHKEESKIRIWKLENPPKYKVGEKSTCGTFVCSSVELIEYDLFHSWRYEIVNIKTGIKLLSPNSWEVVDKMNGNYAARNGASFPNKKEPNTH